ncbi:MAG TPA: hypothetical protein ENJ82_14390, partial [Bacteroidetes bacterium]|nr:hypothetical protein [Bacteroidota bacterium]
MINWKSTLFALLLLLPIFGQAQVGDPKETQFGIRFGYGLEFPSENPFQGESFALFEAGHRLNFGGYVNLQAEPNVQFSPF